MSDGDLQSLQRQTRQLSFCENENLRNKKQAFRPIVAFKVGIHVLSAYVEPQKKGLDYPKETRGNSRGTSSMQISGMNGLFNR